MTDVFTPSQRSAIMARIKNKNTKPELIVRRIAHSLGYRFRLHQGNLPGKPDIVFSHHRKIIMVHGCFWHGHARCVRAMLPATNSDFWRAKILDNRARDTRVRRLLRGQGWQVLVIWQCQTRNHDQVAKRLQEFLN